MAQLKDSIVSGNLRVTDEILTNLLQTGILRIPTSSGGTAYGLGTSDQIIKSNGSSVYWADDKPNLFYIPRVTKSCNTLPGLNTGIIEEYSAGVNYNLPTNHYYHIYSTQGTDTKYGVQLALGMTTTGAYYRVYNNSSWGNWQSLINTWRGIQDNLTSSTNTTESLSAKQGYLLANGSARDNTKVKGLSSGTTSGHIVTWGSDGYTVADSGYTIATSVPSGAVFTDEKIKQTLNSEDKNYPLIFSKQENSSATSPVTEDVYRNNSIYINPSTGDLTTTNGRITGKLLSELSTGTGTAARDKGSGQTNRYVPAKWTFNTGKTATDGDIITIKIPIAGHDFGVYMSIDNGTNYYPIVCNSTGRLTTHYPVNNYITVVFEPSGSAASMFPLNGGDARVTVTGGVWRVINYYDSNSNDTGYYLRRIYNNLKAGTNKIFPYTIIMQNADGRWESIVTSSSTASSKTRNAHGFRLGQVLLMYANATYNADAVVGTYNIWSMHSGLIDHRYSFNTENNATKGTTGYKPIYLVGTINSTDGLFYLDETWWTQTLPSTDNGKVYIYIGDAYDYYRMTFVDTQKFYKYTNGALREISQDTVTVNGHAVNKDVPSDAVFTDTNYYHTTGSWSGLTYTATANGGVGALAFTIPTGTNSTTVALGNHTHTTTIAAGASSDTNQLTLAFGTKYKLTTGGTNFVFTTPSNPNTDRYVNSASFAHDSTNNNVKMTLTRAGSDTNTVIANIPKVSSSTAGVAPKGATVSSQSQSTKFLREDGSWAAPSYTTNTNTWRNIKVNGTEKLGTGTGTGALNFINGTNTTVTYDSGIKISATDSKVEQNETSSTNLYPILFSSRQIDDSSTGAYVANRNSQIYVKPGDGALRAYYLSSNQMSCNVLHITTTHEDQTISSMITQPFVSGVNLQHDLPCTSGILLNDTDFNEIHEVIFDDTNSGTTATNPIDFDITDEIDRIKYIDILYTDTNYQKTVNGYNIEQKSENFGFLRIPFDKVRYTYSISANVPSTLFSLSLIGDKNSYYIRKQTYALSIVQSGSQQADPTYTLDIREFNSGLVIQFYGTPGTGTYANMTTRAQYTNAIRILKVVLIKELKEQQ